MSKLFIIVTCCFFILILERHQCYSSEENQDDHSSDETRSPRRHSRGHHRESHPSDSSSSHGQDRESHPSHSSTSQSQGRSHRHRVNMPSGAVVKISDPVPPDMPTSSVRCGKPTLISLNPSGKLGRKEYPIIAREMELTNERDERFEITKLQKIVNPCAWQAYTEQRSQIEGESGSANETMLFYGSSRTRELVVNGFSDSYTSHGDLGEGFYFTEHSSGAHKYSGTSGLLLLCRVSLGKVKSFGYKGWRSGHPPVGYNSVRYVTRRGYSPYLVAYRGEQIYPEYLITYSVQSASDSRPSSNENDD